VTIDKLGGCVTAPINKTMFGCRKCFIIATWQEKLEYSSNQQQANYSKMAPLLMFWVYKSSIIQNICHHVLKYKNLYTKNFRNGEDPYSVRIFNHTSRMNSLKRSA
jgi:hypothetical protein